MDAAVQRHAAFKVQQELDATRFELIGEIAASLDHLNHAFGAWRLFQKVIDLIEGGFQIPAGVLGVGIGIAADGVDADVDAVANQPWRDGVPYRRFLADGSAIQLLIDIAMPFHDHMLF